ncbi:MAG: hypothetical protein IJE22_00575 [Oscillibacter sp.]|nr:hypothetical protein [Oscillibacter sp.]
MEKVFLHRYKAVTYEIFFAEEDGMLRYGIRAEWRGEVEAVSDITTRKEDAEALLELLRRCGVPPIALRDVVEDWLER